MDGGAVGPAAQHREALARIDRLATLLDARFRVPLTRIRFGWDAILGLVPGVGDGIALLPSLYVLGAAVRLGLGPGVILRMLGNVGLDWLIGLVPLIGDLFDIGFKANLRNARLIRQVVETRAARRHWRDTAP